MGSVFPIIFAFKAPTSLSDTFHYCSQFTNNKRRKDKRLNNVPKLPRPVEQTPAVQRHHITVVSRSNALHHPQ